MLVCIRKRTLRERVAGEDFLLAILYHEWFETQDAKTQAKS